MGDVDVSLPAFVHVVIVDKVLSVLAAEGKFFVYSDEFGNFEVPTHSVHSVTSLN